MSSLKRSIREHLIESYLYIHWWFSRGSCVSDLLTWDHHGTLCIWIHILVHFLTWFSDLCMGCSKYDKVCMKVVSDHKRSVTPYKESEHPMWSHRSMILKVFDQSKMIIRKRFLIYHQLNHHLLIEIYIDKKLNLIYFYAHNSSGMLFDWRIELHETYD